MYFNMCCFLFKTNLYCVPLVFADTLHCESCGHCWSGRYVNRQMMVTGIVAMGHVMLIKLCNARA